ncbi:MAG: hypothetical protein ACHQM6_08645 [Candidatus Kapaibacterium sp.]
MNIISILFAILIVVIVANSIRRSIRRIKEQRDNPYAPQPGPPIIYGAWQGHNLGTTTMEPGDLTRIEEELREEGKAEEE